MDAYTIKNGIINNFELAVKESNSERRKELLSFVIIGAGPTGVELITEIHDYIFNTILPKFKLSIDKSEVSIYLINKADKVLGNFDENISNYSTNVLDKLENLEVLNNHEIKHIIDNVVCFESDEEKEKNIKSYNIYWVAGVTPNLPEIKGSIEYLPSKRIKIKDTLNLDNYPNVFAIGDCAGTKPTLAQIATRQAKIVAKNIILSSKSEQLLSFEYKIKGKLLSLGKKKAAANIYGIFLDGFIAWFLWRTVYLFNFIYWSKIIKVAVDWTVGLFSNRDMSRIS